MEGPVVVYCEASVHEFLHCPYSFVPAGVAGKEGAFERALEAVAKTLEDEDVQVSRWYDGW